MSQRSIEILIGRVITDEAFRGAFRRDAKRTLTEFIESGYDLTPVEIAALAATPFDVWERVAKRVDARLQKASFTAPSTSGMSGDAEEEPCAND